MARRRLTKLWDETVRPTALIDIDPKKLVSRSAI